MREMVARYDGRCKNCGQAVRAGDTIRWSRATGALCAGGCARTDVHDDETYAFGGAHRADIQAEADWEAAEIAREEAEYQRGYHGTAAIQAISTAGSAFREQLYAEQEAQWAREGFDG